MLSIYSVVSIGVWNMNNKSAIFLIFGSFNPPTVAHRKMCNEVDKYRSSNDYIIFVPAKNEYLKSDWKKQDKILDIETRTKLLQDCIDIPQCNVSNCEKRLSGNTYDTIQYFKEKYPEKSVYIVLGADNLTHMNRWCKWENLVKENCFLVFQRSKNTVDKVLPDFLQPYKDHFTFVPFDMADCSSTKVREAVKNNDWETVKKLTPINVYFYLKENSIWTQQD